MTPPRRQSMPSHPADVPISGIVCPIVTPLGPDEDLDERTLRRQLRRLVGSVDGIMALGTTGEAPLLSETVAERVVQTVLETAHGAATIIVGIGDTGTHRTLKNLRRIPREVDFVAVCPPYYYPTPTIDALRRHYLEIADRSDVPVVLYNIPSNTHQVIPIQLVEILASHPNIVGIKDSSGDEAYLRSLLALAPDGFSVLQGTCEAQAEHFFRLGVHGYVSGLENVRPGILSALRSAATRGDSKELAQLQSIVITLLEILESGFWLSALKCAVSMIDGGTGRPASPLPAVGSDKQVEIRKKLEHLGIGLLPEMHQTK